MLHSIRIAVSLALLFSASATVVRADNPPASTPAPAASPEDIILDATVHIDRLRYDTIPAKAHVRLSGNGNCATHYTVKRTNLPAHPQAGVTYRNVTIVLHAAGSLAQAKSTAQCPPR